MRGKDTGNCIEHSIYITGQGKEQKGKMTVYAFDRLRKQTLDQENNRKRGKPSRKDKTFQCVSFMSFVIESCDSVTTLATAQRVLAVATGTE